MKIRKILLWSIVSNSNHSQLTEDEKSVNNYVNLIKCLFPGIVFRNIDDFPQVMSNFVKTVINKVFPKLKDLKQEEVSSTQMVEVGGFLLCEQDEYLTTSWIEKFQDKIQNN